MPALNKRKKGQQNSKAARAREQEANQEAAGEAAPAMNPEPEPQPQLELSPMQLADVNDEAAEFDVADFGSVIAVTTQFAGALSGGKSFMLNNSAWSGYSGGTSRCTIDGFVAEFSWRDSPPGRALIVRTVADGFHYAFRPDQILPSLSPRVRPLAEKEMRVIELRARLERGFDVPNLNASPPADMPVSHAAIDPELRRLTKLVWLSERLGRRWVGSSEQLDKEYEQAARVGRLRPANDDELRNERRRRPRHLNAARNAAELFSYDTVAHERAEKVSVGAMGQCDDTDCLGVGCSCETRFKCTHCGALLFPGEARVAPVVGKFGTNWQGGKFCCSQGQVDLPQIERDEVVENLWMQHRKRMTAHSRQLNNALALASTPVKTPTPPGGGWNPSVVIQGKLHHKVGPLAVGDGETPRYAQLYVHDPAAEGDTVLAQRYAAMLMPAKTSQPEAARLKTLLNELHDALNDCNSYGNADAPVASSCMSMLAQLLNYRFSCVSARFRDGWRDLSAGGHCKRAICHQSG
jgi:hypothetical protein